MGNCIVLVKRDHRKKVLIEYNKAPVVKVHHEVSPLLQEPQTKQLHVKKKVKFADEEEVVVKESSGKGCSSISEVVRIKVVITKKELQALVLSEGELRVQDGNMVVQDYDPLLHKEQSSDCIGWKPALDSIPELD
ncbi:hypothetical protein HAX54_011477 [Datura stramonium]|uniref:Uncharacterized protein n=1 Tax=Datura stramonium TaxID=4076 RepID=A0ABS8TI33_DATST|nr:hypothetical protein [Datura stramonium]